MGTGQALPAYGKGGMQHGSTCAHDDMNALRNRCTGRKGGTAAAVDLLHLPSKKRWGLAQSWQDSTRHRGAPPAVAQPSCTMPWRRHTAEPAIRTSSAEGVMRERPRRRSSTGTALTSVQSLSMLPSWLREAPEPSTAPVGRPLLTRSCGGPRYCEGSTPANEVNCPGLIAVGRAV